MTYSEDDQTDFEEILSEGFGNEKISDEEATDVEDLYGEGEELQELNFE